MPRPKGAPDKQPRKVRSDDGADPSTQRQSRAADKAAGIAFAKALLQARREGKESFTLGPDKTPGTAAPIEIKPSGEARIRSNAGGWSL